MSFITKFTYLIENKAVKAGFIYRMASKYYEQAIESEVTLADIDEKDHVLCIGGGICPFSAILIHQMTGAFVTVIDNNIKCLPKAKKLVKRLGLAEKIRVLYQEGDSSTIDFSQYTVVHLALQVSPMEQVMLAVEKNMQPGTKLLIRRPKKQLSSIYSSLTEKLLSFCPYACHKGRNMGSTVLYIKPETKALVKEYGLVA